MDETQSPSPVEDGTLSLEAWLADPEHAVIFRDPALLASLDIDLVTPPGTPLLDDIQQRPSSSNSSSGCHFDPMAAATTVMATTLPAGASGWEGKRRLSYTQWKRMRIQSRNNQRAAIS